MRIRYLLGPAGSGKTFQCLEEIRRELVRAADGPPLLLLAPKQSTYQLERRLLEDGKLNGYTRLQILSFERLARWAFHRAGKPLPAMLDEEGRVMVLRSLLARNRQKLQLFRASAHLAGFAEELSAALLEIQASGLTPDGLRQSASRVRAQAGLGPKLLDLAFVLERYLEWLEAHGLLDAGLLFDEATRALAETSADTAERPCVWVDGFVEFSAQELALLKGLVRHADEALLTFCLDANARDVSWLSSWWVTRRNFDRCREQLAGFSSSQPEIVVLSRDASVGRFATSPVLRHLEISWTDAEPSTPSPILPDRSLGYCVCADPEAEAVMAAREVLKFVRGGGRYRNVCVLVRSFDQYQDPLRKVFSRYEIPFFLDRRELVSHHPLAELTRSALRAVAFDWQRDDWFAALKTGLAPVDEQTVDKLENEALARGWKGTVWFKPLMVADDPQLTAWLQEVQERVLPPFQQLAESFGAVRNHPDGPQLAAALRQLWGALRAEEFLEKWAEEECPGGESQVSGSAHRTVWDQMNVWLGNLELAFAGEALSLRDWLPVLESGLANLTVGLVPPVLDQVLIGAVDRRRNPETDLVLVLGLNEGVFPAARPSASLLSESDRLELERLNLDFGRTMRAHLARERHLFYLALTRARKRLVLARSNRDAHGAGLSASPLLSRVFELLPGLETQQVEGQPEFETVLHASELHGPLIRAAMGRGGDRTLPESWLHVPGLSTTIGSLPSIGLDRDEAPLGADLAAALYGQVLRTSVSRMEQFASCPFQFFVRSGLRAEERQLFELDARERGSFQHDVLARFHQELQKEGLRWRDITPKEARERVGRIARNLASHYGGGLLEFSDQTRFLSRVLAASLQDFVEVLVTWMREQYAFDPVEVEFPFGLGGEAPPWSIPLAGAKSLELNGRIDRVDLCRDPQTGAALCVVVDYKSSTRQVDMLLVQHGIQLQLLAYLNVLRHWPDPRRWFSVDRLVPAGVFYVNLRGSYKGEQNRSSALHDPEQDRKLAYRHAGRFDTRALRYLDSRRDVPGGDQFNYRLTKNGEIKGNCREALSTADFEELLRGIEQTLKRMGEQVFSGLTTVAPYRKGAQTACAKCDYRAICRVDPWTVAFRLLKPGTRVEEHEEESGAEEAPQAE